MKKIGNSVLVPFALLVVIQCIALDPLHPWGDDFAAYIEQGKSFIRGGIETYYQENKYTVDHSSHAFGPYTYPWGLPILLGILTGIFGESILLFKLVGVGSWLGATWILWVWSGKYMSGGYRFLVCSIFASTPALMGVSMQIQSDLPFMFLSTAVLALVDTKRAPVGSDARKSWFWQLALGFLIGFAVITRTNGVFLLAALATKDVFPLWDAMKKRNLGRTLRSDPVWWLSPYGVAFGVIVCSYVSLPGGGGSHFSHFLGFEPWMLRYNATYYFYAMSEVLTPFGLGRYSVWFLYPLVIIGLWAMRREAAPSAVYFVLTCGLFLFWPWREGIRYMLPLIPIYLLYLGAGVQYQGKRGQRMPLKLITGVVAGFMLLGIANNIYRSFRLASSEGRVAYLANTGPHSAPAAELYAWVSDHTQEDDIIVFFKPRLLRQVTGRKKTVMINKVHELRQGMVLCLNHFDDQELRISDEQFAASIWANSALLFANDLFSVYRLHATEEPM